MYLHKSFNGSFSFFLLIEFQCICSDKIKLFGPFSTNDYKCNLLEKLSVTFS